MKRNILSVITLTTFVAAISLSAESAAGADRTSRKNANKVQSQKPQANPNASAKIAPDAPLAEAWNYVKGEWIHSDGYKYVNGQVIRTGTQTRFHRRIVPTHAADHYSCRTADA